MTTDIRCPGCNGENPSGAELCTLCRTPRPAWRDTEPRQFIANLDGRELLISLFDGGRHVEVAPSNGASRWGAPLPCRLVAS